MVNETGGPAFPTENEHQSGASTYHFEGMTLRDYFAAKALTGYLAADDLRWSFDELGAATYRMADAMLKARDA